MDMILVRPLSRRTDLLRDDTSANLANVLEILLYVSRRAPLHVGQIGFDRWPLQTVHAAKVGACPIGTLVREDHQRIEVKSIEDIVAGTGWQIGERPAPRGVSRRLSKGHRQSSARRNAYGG